MSCQNRKNPCCQDRPTLGVAPSVNHEHRANDAATCGANDHGAATAGGDCTSSTVHRRLLEDSSTDSHDCVLDSIKPARPAKVPAVPHSEAMAATQWQFTQAPSLFNPAMVSQLQDPHWQAVEYHFHAVVDGLKGCISSCKDLLRDKPLFGGSGSSAASFGGGGGGGGGAISAPSSLSVASLLHSHSIVLLLTCVSILMSAVSLALVLSLPPPLHQETTLSTIDTEPLPTTGNTVTGSNTLTGGNAHTAFLPQDLSRGPLLLGSRQSGASANAVVDAGSVSSSFGNSSNAQVGVTSSSRNDTTSNTSSGSSITGRSSNSSGGRSSGAEGGASGRANAGGINGNSQHPSEASAVAVSDSQQLSEASAVAVLMAQPTSPHPLQPAAAAPVGDTADVAATGESVTVGEAGAGGETATGGEQAAGGEAETAGELATGGETATGGEAATGGETAAAGETATATGGEETAAGAAGAAEATSAEEEASWDGAQAIVHIKTSVLPLALQRLCQASALSTLHNTTVGVLWHLRPHTPPPASREAATATETPPPLPFSALLVPPQGVAVRVSLPAGVVAEGKRLQVQQADRTEDFGIAPVKRKCGEREEEEWSPLMLPMEVYVPRSLARAMASTGPCRLYDETMRCYQALQPSAAVQAMVDGEDVGRVRGTTGVLLEDPKVSGATAAAASCPNAKLLPTCLIRNLTSLFLRHPALDFTLAAASSPLPARSVASAFHPNRAPLLPLAAAWRAEHCGGGGSADIATACYQRLLAELFLLADAPSLIFTHKSPAFSFVVARGSTRQSRGLEGAFRVVQPALCAAACPKPLLENKFAQHMIVDESLKVLYCALPKVGNTSWKLWFRLMKLRGNYSEFHSFNKTSSDNNAGSSANGTAAADAGVGGTAAAEGTAAPAAAAAAAAAAASEPAAINITTEDFKMIHLRGLNGLTELPDFHEEAAIRFITRRDVFRFTFVRNPLTRATSAFLDKFVHARNFTNEGDARLYWADAMFGQTKLLKKMLKEHPTGEFSFAEYLVLVEEALKGDADKIENHIDKQIDLCALDHVHYDFVGRFENMSADVAAVMRQLNTSDLGIFQKGKSLQLTGADQRSAQLYDKDSLERANRIYSDDMSIPFNAIRYDIPEALKQVAARENDTRTPATATSRKLRILESPR